MEALKSHEHLYLLLESDEAPMHASTLLLYEGGAATAPDIEAISAFMAARVSRARVLRRRLAALPLAVARPCWIDDPAVDIAAHVTGVTLPAPGGWRELCAEVARRHARPLDPERPLWEACVIEGLDRQPGVGTGAFAILLKTHCATHGETLSAQLFAALHELAPDSRASPPKIVPRYDRRATWAGLASRSTIDAVQRPLRVYRDAVLHWRPWLAYGAAQVSEWAQRIARRGGAGEHRAPSTRFNGRIGSPRVVGGVSYARSDIERIRDRVAGATIDDVGIAIVGAAMARYLAAQGSPPVGPLVAEAPLAHHAGAPRFGSGSFADSALLSLQTQAAEPLAQLRAIVAERHRRLGSERAISARTLLLDAMELVPAVALRAAGKAAHRLRLGSLVAPVANTTITAIHAPGVPLYFAGAKLAGCFGFPPVHDLAGIAHSISSGHRTITVGFAGCATMLPEPVLYERCLCDAYTALAAARSTGTTCRAVPRVRRAHQRTGRRLERPRMQRIV